MDIKDQKLIDSIMGALSIVGVAYDEVTDECPYGVGPARTLEYVLDLCEELGIRTVNLDGKIAWAEIGEGDEIVGILGHLDVVPIGEGWTHNPAGEIVGDEIYGRGVIDDKGPVIAAIYAMKEIQDSGMKLGRRIRLILGQCEEAGDWVDINYYVETQQLPVFGFTPDANFPAIYGEKWIIHYELTAPLDEAIVSIEGGTAANVIPSKCKAVLADGEEVTAEGKSGHASMPETGVNAISLLMEKLYDKGVRTKLTDFFKEHVGTDIHGERMGCHFVDEQSGELTLNVGTIRTTEDAVKIIIDIRNPVTYSIDQVTEVIEKAAKEYGISVELKNSERSVYMDKNGRVIQTMLGAYQEMTGDMSDPIVIGGGTYARAMDGIVAFGPMLPGRECTEHMPDEHLPMADLILCRDIYKKALEKLVNL